MERGSEDLPYIVRYYLNDRLYAARHSMTHGHTSRRGGGGGRQISKTHSQKHNTPTVALHAHHTFVPHPHGDRAAQADDPWIWTGMEMPGGRGVRVQCVRKLRLGGLP